MRRTAIKRKIVASRRQPSGMKSRHRTTIRCNIQALHHQPLDAKLKCCNVSHQAQNPVIAPPSGTKSKHRAASHRAQNPSIALPAIGHNIKHPATIGRLSQALRHHWALLLGIAPPSGAI
jgi:hypothetical protein